MADREAFVRYVREAFAHLDDPPYLATHPLVGLLFGSGEPATPEMLRRLLLAALAGLRPPEGTPIDSPSWRRWRAATLRYADSLTSWQIARELGTSLRQAQRDQREGVDAAAAVLWQTHGQRARPSGAAPDRGPGPARWSARGSASDDSLGAELARASGPSAVTLTSLRQEIEGAVATLRGLLEEHGARVDVAIPASMRPVPVNAAALRQILLCLLTASVQGRSTPTVAISAVDGDEAIQVILLVESSGASAPRSRDAAEQRGALLETAARLAGLSGGTLEVAGPTPDLPTRMVLTMPIAPGKTVLVVDDNPDVAELFQTYLAGTEYRLVQARTGATALRLARELRPHAVTLDVLMPSQDGWEILRQLRDDPATRDIPVIVCSIVPEQPIAMSLGADAFLSKPVTPQRLLAVLEEAAGAGRRPGRPGRHVDT